MGTFNNVRMGTGSLKINGADVGYLKGDVNYKYNYEIEDFKTGIPRSLRGSVTKEIIAELSAPMAEITGYNIGMVLGGLTPVSTPGTEVDKTATFESHTFAADPNSPGIESVKLGATAAYALPVTITALSLEVWNSAETVQYTEFDDFICDYTTGRIFRNPNGLIGAGAVTKYKYKYTPTASDQVNLGVSFALANVSLEFSSVSPITGNNMTVYMHMANSNGQAEMPFAEEGWMIMNPTFRALFDDSHPLNPLGYINIEV